MLSPHLSNTQPTQFSDKTPSNNLSRRPQLPLFRRYIFGPTAATIYSSAAMFYNNPFGIWSEGQSSSSVFGALPYPVDSVDLVTFYFTSFGPDIFNCTVVGPKAQPFYRVVTNSQMPGYTVIKNMDGGSVSLIEWQQHPFIEVRGAVSKQNIRNWLRLSPNQDSRSMEIRGMRYLWVPRKESINLYAASSGTPTFFGRITRSNGGIKLDITPDAMQMGLLDIVVTASFLLQCGRNVD